MKRTSALLGIGTLIAALVTLNQNCSKVSLGQSDNASELLSKYDAVPVRYALAYGDSPDDQNFLAERIKGLPGPTIKNIFERWRRFSDNTIYASAADVVPDPTRAECFTGLDANGNFKPGSRVVNGKTVAFDPAKDGACINVPSLAAVSWSFLDAPARLHNGVNAGNFNGFISSLPYEFFTSEATLTSTDGDDDSIGLIIAAVVRDGQVHTLSAIRHKGGSPGLNFSLVHRLGNTVVSFAAGKAIGSSNTKPNNGPGWGGLKSRVRVQRDGDKITASATDFDLDATKLTFASANVLSIDLSDSKLDLDMFRGPQFYGYGILSQAYSDFVDIKFTTTTPDMYLYDLKTDLVYQQISTGGYQVAPGLSAVRSLGFPSLVVNTETQRRFKIFQDLTWKAIAN